GAAPSARQYPCCRLVMTRAGALELLNSLHDLRQQLSPFSRAEFAVNNAYEAWLEAGICSEAEELRTMWTTLSVLFERIWEVGKPVLCGALREKNLPVHEKWTLQLPISGPALGVDSLV